MKKLKLIRLSFVALLLFSVELSAQTQYLLPTSTIRNFTPPHAKAVKTVAQDQNRLITLYRDASQSEFYFCRTREGSNVVERGKIPLVQTGSFIHKTSEIKDFGIIDNKLYFCGKASYSNGVFGAFVAMVDIEALFNSSATITARYFRDITEFEKLDIISNDRLSLIADSTYYYDLTYSTKQFTRHYYQNYGALKDIVHTDNFICVLSQISDYDVCLYRHQKSNTSNFMGKEYVLTCWNQDYKLVGIDNDNVIVGYRTQDYSLGYMTVDLNSSILPLFYRVQDYTKTITSLNDVIYTTNQQVLMLSYSQPTSTDIITVVNPLTSTTYTTYSLEPNSQLVGTKCINIADFGNNRFSTICDGLIWYDNAVSNVNTQCHAVVSTQIVMPNCLRKIVPYNNCPYLTTTAPEDVMNSAIQQTATYSVQCQ